VSGPVHVPIRPDWTCAGCNRPWPCDHTKQRMRAEYQDAGVSLWLVMGMRLLDAAEDLHNLPAGELHARFLGWIRRT
jgi:hypothetical protein